MVRTKCNINADDQLSIEVEKYPCLYDKHLKEYKETDWRENAWREIEHRFEEGNFVGGGGRSVFVGEK